MQSSNKPPAGIHGSATVSNVSAGNPIQCNPKPKPPGR